MVAGAVILVIILIKKSKRKKKKNKNAIKATVVSETESNSIGIESPNRFFMNQRKTRLSIFKNVKSIFFYILCN